MATFTLDDLADLIGQRAGAVADRSYTRTLLDAGMPRIARKFGEEAVETVVAALGGRRPEIVAEAADTLFHLLVLLHASNVPLAEVMKELGRRTSQSGLDEKAARQGAG